MFKKIDSFTLFVASVCAIVSAIAGIVAFKSGIGISPDSVMYLSIADSLAEGRGLIGYNGDFVAGFPPGFPIIIAVMKSIWGKNIFFALFSFNLILNGISLFLMANLIKEIVENRLFQRIAVLILAFNFAIMYNVMMLWSEPFFIFFIALLLTALSKLNRSNGVMIWLILISLLVGAATAIRYAGVVLIPSVALTVILIDYNENKLRAFGKAFFVALLSGLPLLYILAMNYSKTGTFAGEREGAESSFFATGVAVIIALSGALFPILPLLFKGSAAAIIPLIKFPVSNNQEIKQSVSGSLIKSPVLLFSTIFITIYTLFIWLTGSITLIDKPDHRLISPLVFSIFLLLLIPVSKYLKDGLSGTKQRVIILASVVILVMNVLTTLGYFGKIYLNGNQGYSNTVRNTSELLNYYKNNVVKYNYPILSNEPEILYLHHKRQVLNLLSKKELSQNHNALKTAIGQNGAYFFYFTKSKRNYLANPEELKPYFELNKIHSTFDGELYLLKNK